MLSISDVFFPQFSNGVGSFPEGGRSPRAVPRSKERREDTKILKIHFLRYNTFDTFEGENGKFRENGLHWIAEENKICLSMF